MKALLRKLAKMLGIKTRYESEQERMLIEWAREYGGQARMRNAK